MLIQNVNSAIPATGFASDGGPVPVVSSQTSAAPAVIPQLAVKPVSEQQAVQPTDAQLKNALDNINRVMKLNNSNVEFSLDKDTKQVVIKVVDTQNGQVLRQFPSQEILAVSRMIAEAQRGALLKQQA